VSDALDRPTAGLAVRVVLVLVALVAVAWLAVGLRSARLAQEGRGGAQAKLERLSPAQVAHRQDLLRRSLAHNADADPLVRQAALLAFMGRPAAGVPLLRQVVEREPENYDAWAQLAAATARSDPALSRRARARALELNPRAGR
jgi:predicted Zn-dependent protease